MVKSSVHLTYRHAAILHTFASVVCGPINIASNSIELSDKSPAALAHLFRHPDSCLVTNVFKVTGLKAFKQIWFSSTYSKNISMYRIVAFWTGVTAKLSDHFIHRSISMIRSIAYVTMADSGNATWAKAKRFRGRSGACTGQVETRA